MSALEQASALLAGGQALLVQRTAQQAFSSRIE